MVRSFATLASDVSDLKTSVKWMAYAILIIVGLGITIIGIIVALSSRPAARAPSVQRIAGVAQVTA
jgi:hypothetical protein